ncbi:MAG TPA: peptidase [Candidatus Merdenecus merdavium]|nr:peptidase [Candidatus Merdenecus merdavium]
MFEDYKDHFVKAIKSRVFVVIAFFCVLSAILIQHLFKLQIVKGEEYTAEFDKKITKERVVEGTRGSIYDKNGILLAQSVPANNITLEDTIQYSTTKEHQLTLNGVSYQLSKIIETQGETFAPTFYIELDENDHYVFTTQNDTTLLRFKADIFGEPDPEKLKEEEKNATPQEMIDMLTDKDHYLLVDEDITAEDKEKYGLPESFTKQEILDILRIRSAVSANSYQKYISATIATDIKDETMDLILENKDKLQGVSITEQSKRVYTEEYNVAMSNILGYTGKPSTEELDELIKNSEDESIEYNLNDMVGKDGIEKALDEKLQGRKGKETIYVDNLGTELAVTSTTEPQIGQSAYLTIDAKLQKFGYDLLEEKIAGILLSKIINEKEYVKPEGQDQSNIKIPIDDVYFALINNNIVDISLLKNEEASDLEKSVYSKFQTKLSSVTTALETNLKNSDTTPYTNLSKEMKVYQSHIVNNILKNKNINILPESAIDTKDSIYLEWTDPEKENISLSEFLKYAISQNWIDSSKIDVDTKYLDTNEIYSALIDFITEYIQTDKEFHKKIYKYMLLENEISGQEICGMLYEQGVLDKEEDNYNYQSLISGKLSAYNFMLDKISKLEITPAQLALKPCSGSIVMVDPKSGDVVANISYPGFDNNRLSNNDTEYFARLNEDRSSPLYSKSTMEVTAPGSTFKPITAIAGYNEGVVGVNDTFNCYGKFDLVEPERPVNCWNLSGHGTQNMYLGIGNSCNVYFSNVAYLLAKKGDGTYSDDSGLQYLQKYATSFGLDRATGMEINESTSKISNTDAIRSAIGQGTHLYSTAQLARYAATLANRGTLYNLTLVDKITDSQGEVMEDHVAEVANELDYNQELWDALQQGMDKVTRDGEATQELRKSLSLVGKTGTAEESDITPNHALFIGYAPAEDPDYAIAVRVANGYTSKYASHIAGEMMKYQFGLADESELLQGEANILTVKVGRSD